MRACLFLILFLAVSVVYGQTMPFTLRGTVNVDTGTIYLSPGLNSMYYPGSIDRSTAIKDGKFTFTGDIPYPMPVIVTIKDNGKTRYWSKRFLLDKGTQKMDWTVAEKQSTYVTIHNSAGKEQDNYNSYLVDNERELHQTLVAINGLATDAPAETRAQLTKQKEKLVREKEGLIITYTTQHPLSFVPLWEMVFELDKGYSPFLDTFNNILSPKLKNTPTGKMYAAGVAKLRRTAIGSILPKLQVVDAGGKAVTLKTASKFTFIDFWFTGCYPCIRLFPGFQKIYEAYHPKGFEFIAISTDEGAQVDNWRKYIREKPLPWPQYLDRDKANANMLLIERYPTSFLLDDKGTIIAKDLLPEDLERFLKDHLK